MLGFVSQADDNAAPSHDDGPVDMACQTDYTDDWRAMTRRLPKAPRERPPPPPRRTWTQTLSACVTSLIRRGVSSSAVTPAGDVAHGFATIHVHGGADGGGRTPREVDVSVATAAWAPRLVELIQRHSQRRSNALMATAYLLYCILCAPTLAPSVSQPFCMIMIQVD